MGASNSEEKYKMDTNSQQISNDDHISCCLKIFKRSKSSANNWYYENQKPESIFKGLGKITKRVRKEIGPYIFKKKTSENLEFRPIFKDKNGSKYFGQWNPETNTKEGIGIQINKNGSIYEGYIKNNEANYKGRIIYDDGDYYEGDWLNDWIEGQGVYSWLNIGKVEGQWK